MKKMMLLISVLLLNVSFAQEEKQARANDIASKYVLEADGDFFRYVNGNKCQITNAVKEFKISQHEKDSAMVYFKREGDLYVLHNNQSATGSCPAASKKVILENVKKFTVVSTKNTEIVNIALSTSGKLVAWDNTKEVLVQYSISEYVNNVCYGDKEKSFNTYVLFAISNGAYSYSNRTHLYNGQVAKVRGGHDGKAIEMVVTEKSYSDLQTFKKQENVCN